MIKFYADHRHLKLLEKLQSEQGPRLQNRWEREQKKLNYFRPNKKEGRIPASTLPPDESGYHIMFRTKVPKRNG